MSAFDKFIGYDKIKEQLKNYCDCITNPEKYIAIGSKIPKGILLEGDPGMGKTLIANCFIEESKRNSYVIRRSASDDEFIKGVREVFEEAANNTPSIILLDDMDKYANEDNEHKDAKEYVAIQALIDEYADKDIFFIATVNQWRSLPESLIRPGRFDSRIEFDSPKPKDSENILSYYLNQKKLADDVDIELVTRVMCGDSCAELESVINEAGIYAAYKGKDKIDQQSLLCACLKHEYRNDCLMIEELSEELEEDLKAVAVHEVGHAIVSEVLEEGSVNLISVLKHDYCEVNGFTSFKRKTDLHSQKYRVTDALVSLGGKAAAEVVLGIVDTGCMRDIRSADRDIDKLVGDFAQYGFYTGWEHDDSPWCDKNRHKVVAYEMERYYQIAKKIVSQNREIFDALVAELEVSKLLTFRDIERIKKEIGKEYAKPQIV